MKVRFRACPLTQAALLTTLCLATPTARACEIQQAADLPLRAERGFIAAYARIEDRPVTMLVDTGAERTMVTPSAVASLHLARDPHASTRLQGTGGEVTNANAILQSFELGGLRLTSQSYPVASLPEKSGDDFDAAGLVGADLLAAYDVDLDLSQKRMTLYRVRGCEGNYVPWGGASFSVPTRTYGRGVILLSILLENHPLSAVLDSGAAISAISNQAAAQARTDSWSTRGDAAGTSTGVDGNARAVRVHRFDSMTLGPETYRNVALMVSPLQMPAGMDVLLGLDWLRTHRVWIAYHDRQVFVKDTSS